MSEQELKLHVPAAARQRVEQEVKRGKCRSIRLHAMYFDTPERELARARIAIRLRQEGPDWVQTLKMPGANAISRLELNHARPGPVLDLSIYAGTEFEPVLAALQGELDLRYETDVTRLLRNVRVKQGVIELAYDIGMLRAGALDLPISELEFELLSGQPAAIFTVARGWQQRHGLILDARSKSERGDALVRLASVLQTLNDPQDPAAQASRAQAIADFWAPRTALPVALSTSMPRQQALAAISEECLDQVLRNAAVLAEVDTTGICTAGQPEHLHQLRVGIRRLRSAWALFKGWAQLPRPDVQRDLRRHFAVLGDNRDQDVLQDSIVPALQQAGMPPIPPTPASSGADARSLATAPEFQACLLDILEWSLNVLPLDAPTTAADSAPTAASATDLPDLPTIIPLHQAQSAPALRKQLLRRLKRWHGKTINQGRQFSHLEIAAKHELRKACKRLRYSLSFAEALLPSRSLRRYLKQLARVQNLLGEFNDLAVAQNYYQDRAASYPHAWFALGWLSARQGQLALEAQQAFNRLATIKPFWK